MLLRPDSYLAAAIWVSQVGAGRWAFGAVVLLVVGHHGEHLAAHAAPEQPLRLEHARHSHLDHRSPKRKFILFVEIASYTTQINCEC